MFDVKVMSMEFGSRNSVGCLIAEIITCIVVQKLLQVIIRLIDIVEVIHGVRVGTVVQIHQ